ncbi:MAG: DNA repair protein RecO [Bacteroidales bacterium]|nr:DNA repair protein RecO [Bacteroidales bacterium]
MLVPTQGLVLHTVPYSESSVVARVFTRDMGLRSYLVKGVRTSRGKVKQNLLQPLSYLDMTVYENGRGTLQYVKEMHHRVQWSSTVNDGAKRAVLFFMDEVLYKVLREEEPNTGFFDGIVAQLRDLEGLDAVGQRAEVGIFPLLFLLYTARYLGIEPLDNYAAAEPLFYLKEGRFVSRSWCDVASAESDWVLGSEESALLHAVCSAWRGAMPLPSMQLTQRRRLIDILLQYFNLHLTDFRNFQSHHVLHAVLQ